MTRGTNSPNASEVGRDSLWGFMAGSNGWDSWLLGPERGLGNSEAPTWPVEVCNR
ncbi:unannotated protein [freshwater metagenome]|uniref:Unannotated protein n=1 Tax=freshwater metagenome TaxID=449393 RepID=A0A6J6V7J7_9ZZZZ